MSVTKLKTVGHWQTAHRQHGAVAEPWTNPSDTPPSGSREHVRGRVITGMLTGGDAIPDGFAVQDRRKEQAR